MDLSKTINARCPALSLRRTIGVLALQGAFEEHEVWQLFTIRLALSPPEKNGEKNNETTHFSFGLFLKKKPNNKKSAKNCLVFMTILMNQHKLHHLRRCSKSYLNTLWSASGWFRWHFWWEERGWQELKTNNHVILLGIIKKRVKQKYVEISTTTCLYHT